MNVCGFPLCVFTVFLSLVGGLTERQQHIVDHTGSVECLDNVPKNCNVKRLNINRLSNGRNALLSEIRRTILLIGVREQFERIIFEVGLGHNFIGNGLIVVVSLFRCL